MKKRFLRKISMLVATGLLVSSIVTPVFAETETPVFAETETLDNALDIEVPEAGVVLEDGTVFYGVKDGPRPNYGNIKPGEASILDDVLPAYYYSPVEKRTRIFDQTHYGTCWTFGTLGAVESSVLKNIGDLTIDREALELSRVHMAYFTYMADIEDPLHGMDGDSNRIDKREGDPSTDFMNEGGLPAQQIMPLMGWTGAADGKTILPYSDANTAYEKGVIALCKEFIEEYREEIDTFVVSYLDGKSNGWVKFNDGTSINVLDPDNREGLSEIEYHYYFRIFLRLIGIEDNRQYVYAIDPTPAASLAWEDIYHVKGVKIVRDASTPANRAAIKKLIQDYGSAAISYYEGQETNLPESQQRGEFYNSENNSYYCYTPHYTNHAIQVIGWDDNFSKEKFSVEPEGNGAWILKNSWMDAEEADGVCHQGIFYISYYDKTVGNVMAYDVEKADAIDNNYQYDGAAYGHSVSDANKPTTMKAANVFKASASDFEVLKRVAFYTEQSGQDVKVSVYKNLKNNKNPESGSKVAETTTYADYPGYRYVDLVKPVSLKKGETFSVVVTLTRDSGEASIELEQSAMESVAASKEGQSFIFESDSKSWKDVKDLRITETYTDNDEKEVTEQVTVGNVRIKAYTDNTDSQTYQTGIYQTEADTIPLTEEYNNKGKLKARTVDADAVNENSIITVNAGAKFSIKSLTGNAISDFYIIADTSVSNYNGIEKNTESSDAQGMEINQVSNLNGMIIAPGNYQKRKSKAGLVSKKGVVTTKALKGLGTYSMLISFKQGEEVKHLQVNVQNIGFNPSIKTQPISAPTTIQLSLRTENGFTGEPADMRRITWAYNAGKKNKYATASVSPDGRSLTITPKAAVKGKVNISAVINGKKYSTFVKVDTKTH